MSYRSSKVYRGTDAVAFIHVSSTCQLEPETLCFHGQKQMVQTGLEPVTFALLARRSNQLSYKTVLSGVLSRANVQIACNFQGIYRAL